MRDGHPAENDFDEIMGKKPAHHDHKQIKGEGDGLHREGGGPGFNHQDGFAGEKGRVNVRPHDRAAPVRDAIETVNPPLGGSRNATEGGQDFQVPPVHKY